jgi:hypothetical protein
MSFSAAQLAIENEFATNFTGCAVKYENVEFDPTPNSSFAELIVSDTSSRNAAIGQSLHRSTGVIIVNIHTSKGIGTVTGRDLADKAAAVFRNKTFSGITCRSPVVRNAGEVQEWFVVNMMCGFFRDEIH